MLILTRRYNEEILIGDDIKVQVIRIDGGQVRLGITAPTGTRILRAELESVELGATIGSHIGDPEALSKAALRVKDEQRNQAN